MKLEDRLSSIKEVHNILDVAPLAMDLVTSICGEDLGKGAFRAVYEYNLDPRYVVKIEPQNTNCNMVEYLIWEEVKGLTGKLAWVKDWFAPVKWISPNGRVLVMQKTKERKKAKPESVPAFLWDVKDDNFGWIGDKYVCHDYGQFYNFINYPSKMKKVDWSKAQTLSSLNKRPWHKHI